MKLNIAQMIGIIKNYSQNKIPLEFIKEVQTQKGLSGAGTAHLLSECAKYISPEGCYLEIGIYQATNFSLVAKNCSSQCWGVDNFSQEFDENKLYEKPTKEVVQDKLINVANAHIIENDCFEFLEKTKSLNDKKVELYFYDGPHEYEDQVKAIEMSFDILSDEAIIFIDDFCSEAVRKSMIYFRDRYNQKLKLIKIFGSEINLRENFNQGQVVYYFGRNL